MTILEAIQRSADFLGKKGVEAPRLQVELLLAHLLKMPRMKLYLNFERNLSEPETESLRELVRRRGQREPLQYIVGSISFCGLEMAVDRNVLIPRPETEMLAERAWKFLSGLPANPPPRALDLATGSGCIAIALATHVPHAQLQATDLSHEALHLATHNADKNGVAGRVQFHQGDGFGAMQPARQFDLIVSNPPYIPTADMATLDAEVRDFEPRMALDGGADGMDFYRRIAAEAGAFLRNEGRVMLELNDTGSDFVRNIFMRQGWATESIEMDYNKWPRIFVARKAAESHDVPRSKED